MLLTKTAQTIVEKIMSAIKINVNIMNENALIIASGNKARLGEFHAGAQRVIETGKEDEVSLEQSKRMNIKPGISLPIVFKNKTIGVVGITGNPQKIRAFAKLVKHSTELMLEQSYIDEEIFLEARARKSFLLNLLLEPSLDDEEPIAMRAQMLNFSLDCSYLIFAIDIKAYSVKSDDSITNQEQFMKTLCKQFDTSLSLHGKATACTVNDYIAIMVPLQKESSPAKESLLIANVIGIIRRILVFLPTSSAKIGFGGISRSWKQIGHFFFRAISAIKMGKVYDTPQDIYYFENYLCEATLAQIPLNERKQLYVAVLGKLLNRKAEHLNSFILTLKNYFSSEMSIKETAQSLHIHPNTLSFRLSQIKKATGCDPRTFSGAFKLKLALLLMSMDREYLTET